MIIDFHVHTSRSDGLHSPKEIVNAAIKKGLDGLAITDHDIPSPSIKSRDILIIPGIEVSSDLGHILVLGGSPSFRKGTPIVEILEYARENALLVAPAHPFFLHNSIGKAILNYRFDAIEVLNGSMVPGFLNTYAIRVAEMLNIPMIAGSDAHCIDVLGSCYTILDINTHDVDDVIEAVKKGETRVAGSPNFLKNIKCSIKRLPISIRRFLLGYSPYK
ncbi:MAG: CehA/McbA family metallohydrolase [Candidatus Njordarchaeales archaeon]